MSILKRVLHPAARCLTAANLLRAWWGSVEQIPGGTFVADADGNLSDDDWDAVNRVSKRSPAGDEYSRHVAGCKKCRGEE